MGLHDVMGKPVKLEWKGAWRSAVADDVRFQPVIGKSEEGIAAGVRVQHGIAAPKVFWAPQCHDLEGAAKHSERLADSMLADRQRDLEHSATYLGKLSQLEADKELLKQSEPRSNEERDRMLDAMHRERERVWER